MNEWICGRAPRSKMKHKKLTDCYLDIFNSEYASCYDASAYILSALFSLFEEMKEFYVIFFLFSFSNACVHVFVCLIIVDVVVFLLLPLLPLLPSFLLLLCQNGSYAYFAQP